MRGLESVRQVKILPEDWALGGGTALMLHHQHRISKDIDIFFNDAQYLSFLSPRLGREAIWQSDAYDEAGHYVKLRYPEGEIDFIISTMITDLPAANIDIPADLNAGIPGLDVFIEHPVEIALKKLWHCGPELKVRDIFDIAVVAVVAETLLVTKLHHVKSKKAAILERLNRIAPHFFRDSIDELDILPTI